jgi:Cu2+-exporting ATPase
LRAAESREYPGRGIEAVLDGIRWRLGRTEFVTESALPGVTPAVSGAGGSDVVLGHSAAVIAEFAVRDALRADAAEAVEALQRLRVDVVLASGDREQEVERASRVIGVTRTLGGLTPEGKLALVRREQQGGRKALVVGDGINDGPVLAAAYVSCAMGQGSAIALAAADMLLLNDRLMSLAEGVRTARRMLAVMRQNLFWAFFYNMAAVPAAALGWLPPWMAALGMSLSSLAVVLNSARVTLSPADSNRIFPGRCGPQAHPATGAAT